MTEASRNRFTIDLRNKGKEKAIIDAVYSILDELAAHRQTVKEMVTVLDEMTNTICTMAGANEGMRMRLSEVARKNQRNTDIADGAE